MDTHEAPTFEGGFPHRWTAEILPNRPMILPNRHYVYPGAAEEVEKGALEVLIQPRSDGDAIQPFLATCALGFRDPATPTGIWAMPHPDWLCAAAGGYVYLVNVFAPEQFTMLRYRPVLKIVPYRRQLPKDLQSPSGDAQSIFHDAQSASHVAQSAWDDAQSPTGTAQSKAGFLLFIGHHTILAWGREGEAWESDRLSWEGVSVDRMEDGKLYGSGWDLMTDKDLPFVLDLATGKRV